MSFSWCWQMLPDGRRCTLETGHAGDCGQPPPAADDTRPARPHRDPKPASPKQLRDEVEELTGPQQFETYVSPDKDVRPREVVHVYRADRRKPPRTVRRLRNREPVEETIPGDLIPTPTVTDREWQRRRSGFEFDITLPPLIVQLEQLRGGNAAKVEMSSGRRAPSSRPPAGADVADLITDVTVTANKLLADALREVGRDKELTYRDRRTGQATTLYLDAEAALRRLADMSEEFTPELRGRATAAVRSWKNAARLLLSVNAAMSTLEWPCPLCGSELMVRADVSSDVMCTNDDCTNDNGQRTRWPRQRWGLLLADVESESS